MIKKPLNHPPSLRFFYCGQGDTILIASGQDQWGLVDCNLTERSLARRRLDRLLDENRVERLEFVCVTHPHRDHYLGLRRFLQERMGAKRFASDDFKFAEYWDSGLFGVAWALMSCAGENSTAKELKGLLETLAPLILGDKIRYRLLSGAPHACRMFGEFYVVCLAPQQNRLERFRWQLLEPLANYTYRDLKFEREELNSLSAVLAFVHITSGTTVLLGADATVKAWQEALTVWEELSSGVGRFNVVKVSHHGALRNFHPPLFETWCHPQNPVAVLSVGPGDPEHPHAEVVSLLAKYGIATHFTCKPIGDAPPPRSDLLFTGVPVEGLGASAVPANAKHAFVDIEIQIPDEGPPKVIEIECKP
jgi:beta-lactamase superfamily II metal-dependent hydrolase